MIESAPDLARRFGGLERLYGVAGAARIRNAHVIVVGIGGKQLKAALRETLASSRMALDIRPHRSALEIVRENQRTIDHAVSDEIC